MSSGAQAEISELLDGLERSEPVSWSSGTPDLTESEPVERIVELGRDIVPFLIEELKRDAAPQRTAYVVLSLRSIGDARAVGAIADVAARYRAREPKNEWDHAVIGQAEIALEQLDRDA